MAKRRKTGGRKKGTPNKFTAEVKDAIVEAANLAGGKGGAVAYLTRVAKKHPGVFCALLGRVVPLQVTGKDGGGVLVKIVDLTGAKQQPAEEGTPNA